MTNEHVVVFSEASHMSKFKLLMNRMIPSVSQVGGRIVVISTPSYGSDFNELMTEEAEGWHKTIVRADEMLEADGTPVYTEEELNRNRANMSVSEFAQEYECALDMTNETSIYGQSMGLAHIDGNLQGLQQQLYVSFDLGIADYTVLTFARRTQKGNLKIVHHLGINGVGSKYYSDYIDQYCKEHNIPRQAVQLLLPFDSQNRQRGFDSNTTTFQQLQNVGWNCQLVPRCGQVDGINITKRAIENHQIEFYNDSNMQSFMKKIKSYEYKKNTDGKTTYIPDHGKAGDAPSNYADSLEYMCIFFWKAQYESTKYGGFIPKQNTYNNPFNRR